MINRNCNLVLRDLFYYDVVAAFPTIMQQQHYDFGNILLDDKEERNIFIGKEQRDNKNLSSFLNNSVTSIVDYYLTINEIDESEIIFRQKDGVILTRKLLVNNQFIELKLRKILSLLLISLDRSNMIYFDDFGELSVKGIRHYYDRLDDIYRMFYKLDFYNKKILFQQLQYIKDKVVNNDDIMFYGIKKDDSRFTFITKTGSITVHDIDFVNPEDIDKQKYFNFYFKPFIDSIYLEVVKNAKYR